jgi:hypothetical protein
MRTETLVAVPAKETAEIIKEEGDQSASPGWRTCFNQI